MNKVCSICGAPDGFHMHVATNGGLLGAVPLPPTAEQTSIARFNALADQVREMDKTIGLRFEAFVGLLIDKNGFDKLDGLANRLDALTKGLVFLHSQSAKEPRAVAKKKAAPLVGKRRRKA